MTSKINNKQIIRKIFFLILSIFFFVMAHPNIFVNKGLGFLGFFIYLPVLILIRYCSIKESAVFGAIYGLFSYGLYAWWLKTFDFTCFLAACIFYLLFLAFIFVLLKISDLLFKKNGWIIQCLCICSFEYIKTLGFLGFSYGVTAYTQWKNLYLIQICDVIGVYGLNLFIIFFACGVSSLINKRKDKRIYNYKKQIESVKRIEETNIKTHVENERLEKIMSQKSTYILLGVWAAFFIGFNIYGKIKLGNFGNKEEIKILAIQSNESPWKNGIEEYTKDIQKLMELTDEALELNPDIQIVVWPETSVVPAIVYNYERKDDERRAKLIDLILKYIDSKKATFVIGNGHEINSQKSIHDVYNSALVFTPKENVIPPEPKVYSKIRLVPFTEYFPYKKTFSNFYRKLLLNNVHMWTQGKEVKVFKKGNLFFATPICFEDTFPEIPRKMVQKGARCFINLSNDSWSKSLVCQNQHLAMSVFRSVENKVPSVRSTTSGQTCLINPDGSIKCMCEPFSYSYSVGTIPVIQQYQKNTIYTRIGDVFGIIPVFVFLILLIIRGIFVIIKKSNK